MKTPLKLPRFEERATERVKGKFSMTHEMLGMLLGFTPDLQIDTISIQDARSVIDIHLSAPSMYSRESGIMLSKRSEGQERIATEWTKGDIIKAMKRFLEKHDDEGHPL